MFHRSLEAREILFYGDPDTTLPYILVVMPINAPRAGYVGPRDFGMAFLHCGGQTARRFGDNLECSRRGVEDEQIVAEPFVIEAVNEAFGKNDVIADVKKDTPSDSTT